MFDALARFGVVEKASIDEAYLDVTERVQELRRNLSSASEAAGEDFAAWPTPESSDSAVYGQIDLANENDLRLLLGAKICQQARAAVTAHTSFTCSGGISHNKMLSKLASARNKPNRQTIVPVTGVQALLEQLPLKSIRGLGGKLGGEACQLLKLGEDPRASDVQSFTLQQLNAALGEKTGAWLYQVVRGVDEEPVKERDKAKSCLAFKSFAPVSNFPALEKWVAMLSAELAERILFEKRQRNRQPKQFQLQYRGRGGAGGSRSCPLPHACSAASGKEASAIASALQTLTRTLLQSLPDLYPCTRVAIGVTNFVEPVAGGGISSFFAKAPLAPPVGNDTAAGDTCATQAQGHKESERAREREGGKEREGGRERKRHGHSSISSFFTTQPTTTITTTTTTTATTTPHPTTTTATTTQPLAASAHTCPDLDVMCEGDCEARRQPAHAAPPPHAGNPSRRDTMLREVAGGGRVGGGDGGGGNGGRGEEGREAVGSSFFFPRGRGSAGDEGVRKPGAGAGGGSGEVSRQDVSQDVPAEVLAEGVGQLVDMGLADEAAARL